ncbi:CPBP family intramembrane metalloprotease [Pseudoalteromonas sp. CST5]|uniref:CPBP family intramembrane glutamic endopeptidase n=1 Tax=unclassified Pseudoalteromonas TaxID=194690 RepID=UPI0023597CA3|nr:MULTISPECIES: CPBP family intramembrane glutamic endopeptidase [unclassified Pseudoalteromonas]MDC9511950.1 CPBP family intramembrane metalloprotease [Pseudoalteromonas sp. CST1]MDC9536186.1 CPBP family intramembrane metalloprotease [Pseudoalteromonas sp. CST3]MDC9540451.1 CPBP family intramembrane metalloprotease [Pseudoalteromonas sp. CST2]MDC9544531.1 CPBP family intramembrane metalloprotease [Pseudoalteromonas sp. CST4]MDC9548363.1 CPBP family intramembrane metalloprotease [Pseudoaltero
MNIILKSLLVIATFVFCHYIMKSFWGSEWTKILTQADASTDVLFIPAKYLFLYAPLLVLTTLLFKRGNMLDAIGLNPAGFNNYTFAALLCCVPMTLGYAYLSNNLNLSLSGLITGSIYAGFFEELIFRAALFGALYRFCRWGFIPAALISSVVFGVGHMYQGGDAISALMAVAVTTVAGTWFAWLYCECGYKIWFPMWMHIFMNAAYGIFSMSGGAVGDLHGNLYKATAIVLSIVYVEALIRRGKKREVTMSTLFINTSAATLNNPIKPQISAAG